LDIQTSTNAVSWPGKKSEDGQVEIKLLWTAANFPETFDLELVAGNYYREGVLTDTNNIVLNERAIEVMGIDDPVGKSITWWGSPRKILGVIKDFHNQSLHNKIEPTGFLLDPENAGWLFVKTEVGKSETAISGLQTSFAKVVPGVPLHYNFLDEKYQRQYKSETLTGQLANYFALISIFISCLGLLGLATFLAEQKTKEIGIRKVLGASTVGIIGLLSKDFIKLVVVALFVSIPIAYFFMNSWLAEFEYRIEIEWWVFAIAGSLAVLVAFATVGFQSARAAMASPSDSLRSE